MKREGPPLDSPVPWKRIKLKVGEDLGKPIYAEVEPFAFNNSRPNSSLHRREDPSVPVMNSFPIPDYWPSTSIQDGSDWGFVNIPGFPIGNCTDFPSFQSWTDLESLYKLDPMDLTQYDCPSEKLNEQFRHIENGYNAWLTTNNEDHTTSDIHLDRWMDLWKDNYSLFQEYMEKNMADELNYFGFLGRSGIYTLQNLKSWPQEWGNMLKLMLLARLVYTVRHYPGLIPWRNMQMRFVNGIENPRFGSGSVLPGRWAAKPGTGNGPDYDPYISREWWKEKHIFVVGLFSKEQLLLEWTKSRKRAEIWLPFLLYCHNSVNGGTPAPYGKTTPVEERPYREFINQLMHSKEEPFIRLNQQVVRDFYQACGKNNVNNNIYTDCQFIFMVFAQMKRHTDQWFSNQDYAELKNLPPSEIPLVEIGKKPDRKSIWDKQPHIYRFKELWYDTSNWSFTGIDARKAWPPPAPHGFTEMKPPDPEDPDRFFSNNMITLIYKYPPPLLVQRGLFQDKYYNPLFEKQWEYYLLWAEENVRNYYREGYVKPNEEFVLTPEQKEYTKKVANTDVAFNTFLDIGLIDQNADKRWYEHLKWLFIPVTLITEGINGGSIWHFTENRGAKLWDIIIKLIKGVIDLAKNLLDEFLPKLLPILALVGGGFLLLTYGQEKVKEYAKSTE